MAGEEGVHRLTDFVVEEVSLVDRAANKRRFLLVKREGGEMAELRSNGRGGFTRVMKAEDEETEKKGKPFPGAAKPFGKPEEGGDKDEEKAKKADGEDGDEEKARKLLADAGLTDAAKRIFANEGDSENERKARAKVDAEGMKLAAEVAKLADELGKVAEDLKSEEADEPSDVHMKKCMAMHKKLGAICEKYMSKVGKSAVAKVGAKMAASRLASFKAAMDSLQSILAELLETPSSAKEHEADAGDPTKAPSGFKANNPSDAPTNAMGKEAIKSLEKQMTKMVDEIVSPLVETCKAQSAELAKLRKSVVGSNALPVEKRGGGQRESVAWPMDMARPVGSQVNKAESFLDD